ncbi:DEAD-box ATP-dependent RNA helicase 58, chloroplastic-like isoform X2 [Camellia sinensis]|uniref:DEAD-box ATP-dependent RNA helicase 58, chloroplastic-like isoform X2 n=1 Tax=Camellia sinensis TaxID=4442 RepID=UPI0010361E83|nr:DEAD-box ATP-dependent RNA helicase 58, chloroplastic-like isoform X2 [Camellia sinensis]
MACFSANQLYSLSWRFSVKPRPQNPNCTRSWFVNRRNRTLSPLSNSNRRPSRASLDSTCVGIEADISERASTIRELCEDHIPDHILRRVEEVGFVVPTDVQRKALPIMLSGRDCILHAQTGSGKTLAYLLSIFAVVNTQRSSVQALIVVPTSELGMQITKVARMLAAKPAEFGEEACCVMALLDGGMLRRHKSWLKVEPPTIVVATLGSLCQMIDKKILKLDSMQVLVIDEVDFMFNSSKQVSSLRKLLISYSLRNNRQTIFASASIPQHKRFLSDCIQQKWTKDDVVHVHVNPVEPMPSRLHHRFVMCGKNERHQTLLSLLRGDAPHSAIIFVSVQSEKSKKAGHAPPTTLLIDLLKTSLPGCFDILMLEEDMNFNLRAASLSEMRQGRSYLLVATDIAARGVDLPEITHIYNFDLPKTAVDYLHRAGRTGRKPLSDNKCFVTSIITSEERFVLQRFENELMFQCTEVFL